MQKKLQCLPLRHTTRVFSSGNFLLAFIYCTARAVSSMAFACCVLPAAAAMLCGSADETARVHFYKRSDY